MTTPTPDRQLTPWAMPLLANRLKETIGRIESWADISVSRSSRVAKAVSVLRSVEQCDVFSGSRDELADIAHAVRDAQSFWVIGNMLGPERLPPIVTSLQAAIGGKLGTMPHSAYRAQSELWVSAMIAAAGTAPGVILKTDDKSPDVIIQNGTMEYSVEVKRPKSLGHVRNMVSNAAKQLLPQRVHGGALAVDLTDCLSPGSGMHFVHGSPSLDGVREEHLLLSERIHRHVFDDSSRRMLDGREHIFAAVSFVRISWWNLDDLSHLHCINQKLPIVYRTDGATLKTPKNLRYHRAHWLAGLIQRGLREVGVEEMGRGEVRFQP